MNKTYYAEGSLYEIDDGEHVRKDSFKMYSPDGKKLNINIDLSGEKMFVRNAQIKDIVTNKTLGRMMPIRSNQPKLIESLENIVENKNIQHTQPQTQTQIKKISNQSTENKSKTNPKSKTLKAPKKHKKSPRKKQKKIEKILPKDVRKNKKSFKKIKKRRKTIKHQEDKKGTSPPAQSAPPISKAISNSFISDKFL